ncbi:13889_t:CDS:2 [Funneliformis mosseae]|uniref:13889_t:CDS:1 n=1 Tax=Funneliformis mosseae TaxID=27381 RepID=A0A9N9BKI9_FUNMO|nr:13889_t:CDS:2 [Funneliformis mosseae]
MVFLANFAIFSEVMSAKSSDLSTLNLCHLIWATIVFCKTL